MESGEETVKKQKNQDAADENQPVIECYRTVVDRANQGDKIALAEVRNMLETSPALAIAVLGGDLAKRAEEILVSRITEEQVTFCESLQAKLKALRAELSGPNPSPIERLLVDRVVTCWLQLSHADVLAAQAERITLTEGDYLQRRQDRAHRRYLSAVKMLAVVRKLALPSLQINVGQNQVNLIGGDEA
jgi:hypothetical protein